jgi:uncharacterized protein involved in high-affinity Fe2+ transport
MTVRARHVLAGALTALALAGCASADKNTTTATKNTAGMGMSGMGGSSAAPSVNGIKPVAIRTLATAYWQDMEIQAQTMTPTPFVVVDGSSEIMHRPPKGASFHLMVMLTSRTPPHYQIPYASVWATVLNRAGKQVWSAQQWPMISEYMGTHYGDNVPHLASGRYTLKLLISPPQEGRHLEYAHMWQHQHTVVTHFTWNAST